MLKSNRKFIKIALLVSSLFVISSTSLYSQDLDLKSNFQEFSTKGHPKAKGLDIRFKYPKDWIAKEGDRPHIVQKFRKEIEKGILIVCTIQIKEGPPELINFSDEEIAKEIFSEEGIKFLFYYEGTNYEGIKILKYVNTKYDGQPGVLVYSTMMADRVGKKLFSYSLFHIFIYSNKLILIGCSVGGEISDISKIKEYFKTYESLFLQIGGSIVVYDKWLSPYEK